MGTGEPLAANVVRLVLATKAVSLARGHSGVRPELADALLRRNLLIWGLGGVIVPFIAIKAIDLVLVVLGLV